MPKVFRFFLYIFANEISIKLFSTKKQKETTMKTSRKKNKKIFNNLKEKKYDKN